MATAKVNKKTKAAAESTAVAAATTPKKSSRIAEQAAKRKAAEDVSPATTKKRKAVVIAEPATKTAAKKADKAEKPKKQQSAKAATSAKAKKAKEEEKEVEEEDEEEEEKEEDATTTALVRAIDSKKGEKEDDVSEDDEPAGGASLFQAGQDVGKAPAAAVSEAAAVVKKKSGSGKKTAEKPADGEEQPMGGVVYVGRIPHGFFEYEMRSYFSQFGDIRRLRLSRNRQTGASKHYAFIEFADRDVADIVAKTMDNYLLFGHLLRCSVVSPDSIPPNLFRGANRRFKAVPWNRLAGARLAVPRSETGWTSKISREAKKRAARAAQVADALGYAYEPPQLKKASAPAAAVGEGAAEEKKKLPEQPAQIEAAPAPAVNEETPAELVAVKAGKAKNAKKAKAVKA